MSTMWPFYPFLNGNSGVTPPYAANGLPESTWPYGFGGGRSGVPAPYSPPGRPSIRPSQLPAARPTAGLPALPDAYTPPPNFTMGQPEYKLPVRSLPRDLASFINFLPPSARSGGLLGPIGAAIGTAASVMAPKPAGDANDNGQGPLLQQPTFPNGVPLPSPRPSTPALSQGFDEAGFTGGTPSVPLPQARPAGPPLSLAPTAAAAMAQAPAPYNPGFGAGDNGLMSPSNMGTGSTQTDFLRQLIAALRQGQ